ESLTRTDLSGEAIRLGRLLVELLPEPEAVGLLALMLLHESRRTARTSPAGEVVLLDDQDRSLWKRDQIAEGLALVDVARWSREDLSRRLGRTAEARTSYEQALALTQQEPERRFLEGRLRELS